MAKTKIVFYGICGSATLFSSLEKAEIAAEEYGRDAGYPCEVFYCEKEHTTRNSTKSGAGWHVRGKNFH